MNLEDYTLLGPVFQESFVTSSMFLMARTVGEYEGVTLSLTVPGMPKEAVDGIRLELVQHLRNTLLSGARRWWIKSVEMKYDAQTGVPHILVEVKNRSFAGADSYRYILDVAEAFVSLYERQLGRRLFVIPGGHRLVPLDFQLVDNRLEVVLPFQVRLVHPYKGSSSILSDFAGEACKLLLSTLTGLMFAIEQKFKSVAVVPTPDGFTITVDFGDADMSDAAALDHNKQVICRLASLHGRFIGRNERLVFCTPELRDRSND